MDCSHKDDFAEISALHYGLSEKLIPECDCILAVGGDGTILRCSGYASEFKKPMLGLTAEGLDLWRLSNIPNLIC